jgi:hypothetical protein
MFIPDLIFTREVYNVQNSLSFAGQVYKEISLTSTGRVPTLSKQNRTIAKENLLQMDFNIFYRYHCSLQGFGSVPYSFDPDPAF